MKNVKKILALVLVLVLVLSLLVGCGSSAPKIDGKYTSVNVMNANTQKVAKSDANTLEIKGDSYVLTIGDTDPIKGTMKFSETKDAFDYYTTDKTSSPAILISFANGSEKTEYQASVYIKFADGVAYLITFNK